MSTYRAQLGARIEQVVARLGSRKAASAAAGVTAEQLAKWIAGTVKVPVEALRDLAQAANDDFAWLATGAPAGSGTATSVDAIAVPRFDIRPSAGAGALVVSEDVAEHFTVGRDWLRRQLPPWAPPNAVVGFLEGNGDSMEPTIRDGDLIMVVKGVTWRVVERGGIFVLSVDDRLLLKRLQVLMTGDLKIISDNRAYEPELVVHDDLEHRVRVLGQVFFSGGKPRSFGL